ncbi:MAG: esterase-like activity of phytase family protein [Deltaproteobacteria bacterium]|nr:esterase-like activity of phytase family protein [Deltaproteobacteria bacterium]
MRRPSATATALVALALGPGWGCSREVKPTEPPVAVEVHLQVGAAFTDTTGQLRGLSDLARDPGGALWVIPERQALLARAVTATDGALTWQTVPLHGKPMEYDGESLTWIGPAAFAIGSERHQKKRETDRIFLGHLDSDKAVVDAQIDLPYSLWSIAADDNRGIEGLCFAHGALWAAVEHVVEKDGQRWAPLGRYDLHTKAWAALRVLLTSTQGRISALACRPLPAGKVELWAIERYYGIVRWLRMTVEGAASGDVVPTVHADLAVATTPVAANVPNFEGLCADPDRPGDAWLVNDNDSGGTVDGANHLVRVTPTGGAAPP